VALRPIHRRRIEEVEGTEGAKRRRGEGRLTRGTGHLKFFDLIAVGRLYRGTSLSKIGKRENSEQQVSSKTASETDPGNGSNRQVSGKKDKGLLEGISGR